MGKIIKKIKNRAGLTLTEMLVTVAILSLFSAAVLTGMTTALSVRRDNIMANDAEIIASMVTNFITNDLRTASKVCNKDGSELKVGEKITKIRYQRNEYPHFNDVVLKLDDNAESYGQLELEFVDAGSTPAYHPFSPAAYSDNSVKRLEIIDLKFTIIASDVIEVTFGVGYNNADGTGDSVRIATAETDFTVRLLNAE